jgi:ankyrin repeat protein
MTVKFSSDTQGFTPLLHAFAQGRLECAKHLLAKGADLNVRDKDGATALHVAAQGGHVECLRHLVTLGIPIAIKDTKGSTGK